jgi:zinc/manganese transport system ATP-binding protein
VTVARRNDQVSPATAAGPVAGGLPPVVEFRDATVAFGNRTLWSGLNLTIEPGEFVAVLGANGSGKTSLLRVLLGDLPLTSGSVTVAGRPVRHGDDRIGYVPQRVAVDAGTMIKARDMVRLGLDGTRWGPSLQFGARRRATRDRVDGLLASVGATAFGEAPVSLLSGGELQRIRIAEALAADPRLLVLDEPLAALDLARQQDIAALVDRQRRARDTAVVFVTHEINAVLEYVDRVLYLAGGRFRWGTPAEVMTSESLTELYGAPVDVLDVHGRLIVLSADEPGRRTEMVPESPEVAAHRTLEDHR